MKLLPFNEPGRLEAGTDEAGRGCLAGPVVAAAVILPDHCDLPLLNDSKQLSEPERDRLAPIIKAQAVSYAVGVVSPARIDEINIRNAAFEAMNIALQQLNPAPDFILVDGNAFKTELDTPYECIIKGDGKFRSIAAASVLAKTHRDAIMCDLHNEYPDYNWASNKGYPTGAHRNAIRLHGSTKHHRTSFRLLPTKGLFN